MKKILLSILFISVFCFANNLYAQTMPEISTDDNEVWYYIQFNKGLAVLEDFGEATPLMTQNVSLINKEQHWKVIAATNPSGNYKYEIVSALGHKLCYSSSRYITSKTSTPALFSIGTSTSAAYSGLVLNNSGSYLTQNGGESFGKTLMRGSSIAAAGSSLVFTPIASMEEPPEAESPKVSSVDNSNETWYYIQFTRSTSTSLIPALQDMGNNANLKTINAQKECDEQLWKIVPATTPNGDYEYQLVCKTGRKVAYASSKYTASSTSSILIKLTEVYPDWAIQRYGGGSNGMNQDGGAGPGREIADYAYGDIGSICKFVTHKDLFGYDYPQKTAIPQVEAEKRIQYTIENRMLSVSGEELKKVAVYTSTGQLLDTKIASFSFDLPAAGIYVLKATYKDQTTETLKLIAK